MKYASKKAQDNSFQLLIHCVFILLSLAAILPFVLLIMSSLTEEKSLLVDGYSFWPKHWSFYAYEWVFFTNAKNIFRAYGITVFVTVVGTILSLLVSPMLAYAISRKDYPLKVTVHGYSAIFIRFVGIAPYQNMQINSPSDNSSPKYSVNHKS
jgi:putative aldouronate transport system permease protein